MRILVSFLLMIASVQVCEAANVWEYNGSTFTLDASGAGRKFLYLSPREGLPVGAGTVVFNGKKAGNSYSGTAYVFSKLCGPIGYPVSGPVAPDQRTVTLSGSVPVRNAKCKVTGQQANTLVFTLQTSDGESSSQTFALRIDGNTPGMHIPVTLRGETLQVRMAQDEHFVFMVEDALKALGRDQDILVLQREGLSVGGFASMWTNFDGKLVKIIVYDPIVFEPARWKLGEVTDKANAASSLLILAHEIGHHVCGHIAGGGGSEPWKEIQADRAAGQILSQSSWRGFFGGLTLDDFTTIMEAIFSPTPSASHPGSFDRIIAFREGWNGRGCN